MRLVIKSIKAARDNNSRSLLCRKKLQLVLDLDNTLLDSKPRKSLTFIESGYIDAKKSSGSTDIHELKDGVHVTKLRPGVHEFLKEASTMFDLSIYTMGNQHYAYRIAEILDEFGDRFRTNPISREVCTTPRQKGLNVVLVDERLVVIVDDKKDVWRDCDKGNVIQIEPYKFFSTKYDPCFGLDESEDRDGIMDDNLAKVLKTLRLVHSSFYDDDFQYDEAEDVCDGGKDVRRVLESVCDYEKQLEDEEERLQRFIEDNGGLGLGLGFNPEWAIEDTEECHWFENPVLAGNKKRSREDICDSYLESCNLVKRFKGCQNQIDLMYAVT